MVVDRLGGARSFTRVELVRLIERLHRAHRDTRRRFELTDYHWLVLYTCLRLFCDLHNDDATGAEDRIGPYEIERIDFDAIVDRFFFDSDFLMGATLLAAEEAAPGQLLVTPQAWKIAAGVRPEPEDLRLTPVERVRESEDARPVDHRVPASGYVGCYPLRQREQGH